MDYTIEMMKQLTEELTEAKAKYEEASKESKTLFAAYDEKKNHYISILEELDTPSYEVPGLARISKIDKLCVQTPKDVEAKKKFFKYIHDNLGADAYWAYMSVNSNTLNSFYNQQIEETGDPMLAEKLGLAAPTVRTTLRVNKR